MVESNKQEFKDLADQTNLPDDRQDSCWNDYASASWSWEKVLQPHSGNPQQPKQKIEVTYAPGKGDFDVYAQAFQSIGMLELVAERFAAYALPNPLGLKMASCGEVNAAWDPQERQVVLCYELAQDFAQLFRDYGQEWQAPPKYRWWQLKRWNRVKGTP